MSASSGSEEIPALDLVGSELPERPQLASDWKVGDLVRGTRKTGGDGRVKCIFEIGGVMRAEVVWPKGTVGTGGHVYENVAQNLDLDTLKRPRAPAPEISSTYTTERFEAYRERLLAGEVSAEKHKREFECLRDAEEEFVSLLLSRHKAPELKRMASRLGDWRASQKKKRENAESIHRSLLQSFVISGSITWSPASESFEETMTRLVEEISDEALAEYGQGEKAAEENRQERRKEERKKIEKALACPQTEEEFVAFCRANGGEEGLSLEQLDAFDRVRADRTRKQRREEKRPAIVEKFAAEEEVSFRLIEGFHQEKKLPLWIVQIEDRVSREAFRELLGKARQLGGWYSSFAKEQAGFQFTSSERAEQFVSLLRGDVDRQDFIEESRRRKELTAGERLLELASSLENAAKEQLVADRCANTPRRAEEAAGIRGRARSDIALAATTRQIGEALGRGDAEFLGGVWNRGQVKLLARTLRLAALARERKAPEGEGGKPVDSGSDRGTPARPRPRAEDIRFIEYPFPSVHVSCLRRAILDAQGKRGALQAARRMAKRIEGEGLIEFASESDAAELLDFISRARAAGVDTTWIERSAEDFKRLRSANLHTLPELRSAARELLPILAVPGKEDPVAAAERELVGRKLPGFFPTPPAALRRLLELADIEPGHRVLEPSCGKGDIMDAIRLAQPAADLTGIELAHSLLEILEAKGHAVTRGDFLLHRGEYDRIVMNPPFENGQDIDHVLYAYGLLVPGGRLVSVMSEGSFFREDTKAQDFRAWLEELGSAAEKLPENTFAAADAFRQTSVSTRIVAIEKSERADAEGPEIRGQL